MYVQLTGSPACLLMGGYLQRDSAHVSDPGDRLIQKGNSLIFLPSLRFSSGHLFPILHQHAHHTTFFTAPLSVPFTLL
jgi:hypothetical protein